MVTYTSIQTLTGGIIKTQWYANGIPVTADEVPQSVKDKCCDCGCGDSGGGGSTEDTNFATSNLTFDADRVHDGAGFEILLEGFKEINLKANDSVSATAKDNKVEIKEDNSVNFNQFTDTHNDTDQNSVAWFDKDGNLKRTNLVDKNIENRHVPTPLISRNYNKELQHAITENITNFSASTFTIKSGRNPSVPVINFDSLDPNTTNIFTPNYPNERGIIYQSTVDSTFWKYANGSYTVFDNKFTYDDLANQGVIWLSAAVESGQDMSFFKDNKPMLIVEVYNSQQKRGLNNTSSNNDFRFKKWQTWDFNKSEFKNLNRPLNTKETGSNGLNQNGNGNGVKYFASQWDFTPTKNNSEMLFRLDVHALFGSLKFSNVPDFNFPVRLIELYSSNQWTPRYLNFKGNTLRYKTSFRQPIRFRFACLDPKDTRNLLYSEPSKTYMLGIKSGEFFEDHYAYQFVIKEVSK